MPRTGNVGVPGVPGVVRAAAGHSAHAEPWGSVARTAIAIAVRTVRICFR